MKALDEQNKKTEAQNKELAAIRVEQEAARLEIVELKRKLEPVHQVFESVTGFNSIAVWILKALVLFGAGLGVIWTLIKYLKN